MLNFIEHKALDILQEECAEVVQIAAKIKHWGPWSHHPDDPKETMNYQLLIQELGDVLALIDVAKNIPHLYITDEALQDAKLRKLNKLKQFHPLIDSLVNF